MTSALAWADVVAAWRKWLADLSSTRTQAGYVAIALSIYSVIARIANPETVIGMLLATWGVVKVMETRKSNTEATK